MLGFVLPEPPLSKEFCSSCSNLTLVPVTMQYSLKLLGLTLTYTFYTYKELLNMKCSITPSANVMRILKLNMIH